MNIHEDLNVISDYGGVVPPPRKAHAQGATPGISLLSRRVEHHVDGLRQQRYRKPSLLMHWLQSFDSSTYAHCVRVAELSFQLGNTLGLERAGLRLLERAALLHDAGKLCMPLDVLHKRARLSAEEWAMMREHPLAGETICLEATSDGQLSALVRQHHERLDGSGYPDHRRADAISLSVRVLQMADIYDALTSERAYKPAYSRDRALDIIDQEVAWGWRDETVASALRDVVC